jgi:hypothetical protein
MSTITGSNASLSESTSFKVYYRHNQAQIELKFKDNQIRADQVILQAIEILSDHYMIKLNNNFLHYALYPANKRGEKVSDAIEISHSQRIKGIGVKRFYLEYLNLSKESISTQINLEKKYGFEKQVKIEKGGCCSIFSGI